MMHRVLCLPEILVITLSFTDRKDQKRCALVCQEWCEVALDVLWHELSDFPAFANLLSPVKKKRKSSGIFEYGFDPQPGVKAWGRFQSKYCRRVRKIIFNGNIDTGIIPLLNVISRIRSISTPMFPNLKSIDWRDAYSRFCELNLFMHEGVTECEVVVEGHSLHLHEVQLLAEALQAQMPRLTLLAINTTPRQEYTEPLLELIRSLPDLETLSLPAFSNVSDVVQALASTSKSLKTLRFLQGPPDDDDDDDVPAMAVDEMGLCTCVDLPMLAELELFVTSYAVATTFLDKHWLGALHIIQLNITSIEDRKSTRELFHALSVNCPMLDNLAVGFAIPEMQIVDDAPRRDFITFKDFENILHCKTMTSFEFRTPFALDLCDEDIQTVAIAWPNLKRITLSHDPTSAIDAPKPSLWSIGHFFAHCPQIERIHLLMDTTIRSEPTDTVMIQCSNTFELLDVGKSPLSDADTSSAAMILSRLLLPSCSIVHKCNRDNHSDDDDHSGNDAGRWDGMAKWTSILSEMALAIHEKDQMILDMEDRLHSANARSLSLLRVLELEPEGRKDDGLGHLV
ncbi:hypothetical protein E1B28_010990 [Marasmius oreades]|uniref:F-box domain-containing protein n=1 Tax=Marasmius oreades TaxID=181124 RepID=A0A9P7RTC5_9AGAR|nr:uncharacterized protein E1B28_010990 [Marasmius oreades]KAG7089292.1 hypothetical protein E1B28_010990 [Marasmius oreades]